MSKQPRPVTNPVNSRWVEGPLRVKNETGGTLTRGTLVYVSGIDAATGLRNVTKADADAQGRAAEWIVLKDIANAGVGVVGKRVRLTGQNTDAAASAEDPVYLSTTAGGWTVTAPTDGDPNGLSQIVGYVVVKSATVGVLDLRIAESPVQIGTNEIQDGAVSAAKLGGDVSSLTGVDDVTIEAPADTLQLKDGGITNAKVNAAAAIARSKLAEDALAPHGIPLTSVRGPTGLALTATETAGTFNVDVSTNVVTLKGEVTDNETEVSVGLAEYVLPDNYVAAGDITVRFRVALIATGSPTDNGSTFDLEVYKQGDAAVGADLCATAAATFAALDTWYNKDFTVTAAGLAAGDRLTFKITASVIDSEAGGGTIICTIAAVSVLADVKG